MFRIIPTAAVPVDCLAFLTWARPIAPRMRPMIAGKMAIQPMQRMKHKRTEMIQRTNDAIHILTLLVEFEVVGSVDILHNALFLPQKKGSLQSQCCATCGYWHWATIAAHFVCWLQRGPLLHFQYCHQQILHIIKKYSPLFMVCKCNTLVYYFTQKRRISSFAMCEKKKEDIAKTG